VYLVVFFCFFTFYCILSVFMDCWSDTNKMMMMNDDDDVETCIENESQDGQVSTSA